MSLSKKAMAEFFGTFWLVFGGCGAAYFACGTSNHFGIGYLGVALAFGLTVMTMAYAVGHISGGHFNPAVTAGLMAAGRFDGGAKDAAVYMISQVAGAAVAAAAIFVLAGCPTLNGAVGGFVTNGWSSALDPKGVNAFGGTTFGIGSAIIAETLLTCFFLFVIIGSTDKRAPAGFAPIAIGLCLTLIHLISIPITNTSVNPARSIGMALFNGGESLVQLWVFIVFPVIGAVIAGLIYKNCLEAKECCCGGDCKCEKKCADCKCEKKEDAKEEEKAAE